MIPRVGSTWTVKRGRRRVRIVIDHIQPRRRDNGTRTWVIHYRTEGTWAAGGKRSIYLRGFLKLMTPVKP